MKMELSDQLYTSTLLYDKMQKRIASLKIDNNSLTLKLLNKTSLRNIAIWAQAHSYTPANFIYMRK